MAKSTGVSSGISPTTLPIEVDPVHAGAVIHNPASTGLVSRSLGSYCSPLGTKEWDIPHTTEMDEDSGSVGTG